MNIEFNVSVHKEYNIVLLKLVFHISHKTSDAFTICHRQQMK